MSLWPLCSANKQLLEQNAQMVSQLEEKMVPEVLRKKDTQQQIHLRDAVDTGCAPAATDSDSSYDCEGNSNQSKLYSGPAGLLFIVLKMGNHAVWMWVHTRVPCLARISQKKK